MTDQERQAAERAAVVNFMGTIFGEARKIDRDMVQQSSTLQPTSHRAEQALRSYLQTQPQTHIPPAPQEMVHAGTGGFVQPTYTVPVPDYTQSPVPNYTQPIDNIPHEKSDDLLEISKKLDTIIVLLGELIDLCKVN